MSNNEVIIGSPRLGLTQVWALLCILKDARKVEDYLQDVACGDSPAISPQQLHQIHKRAMWRAQKSIEKEHFVDALRWLSIVDTQQRGLADRIVYDAMVNTCIVCLKRRGYPLSTLWGKLLPHMERRFRCWANSA